LVSTLIPLLTKNIIKFQLTFTTKTLKKSKSKFLVLLPLLDLTYNKKQANSTTNSRLGENKQSPLFLILKEQFLALKEVKIKNKKRLIHENQSLM
jgi:hypothetical protein